MPLIASNLFQDPKVTTQLDTCIMLQSAKATKEPTSQPNTPTKEREKNEREILKPAQIIKHLVKVSAQAHKHTHKVYTLLWQYKTLTLINIK